MLKTTKLIFLMFKWLFTFGVDGGTDAQLRELLIVKLNNVDYSPRVRPIKDTGSALTLTVDMYLVALNDVDEVEQKITTTAYMKVVWSDVFMQWNVSAYGNITEFTLPQDNIWKPDLALANAYDTITGLGDPFIYLTVSSDGKISWEPYQVFDSTCDLDMTYFPFDTQSCDLQLVTWSSTGEMVHIQSGSDGFNTDAFEENANWNLVSVRTFNSTTESTSGLSFSIQIKRKPIFFLINFMIPIVLLSFLNNFVFILPCESGEKTGYAVILFLSFAIFLLIVTEIMPEGMNTIPVMSIYLLFECVLSTAVVFITIIQVRVHSLGEEETVPEYLQKFTKFVQKVKSKVCCETSDGDDSDDEETDVKTPLKVRTDKKVKIKSSLDAPVVSMANDDVGDNTAKYSDMPNNGIPNSSAMLSVGEADKSNGTSWSHKLMDEVNKKKSENMNGDISDQREKSPKNSFSLKLCCYGKVTKVQPESTDNAMELKTTSAKTALRLSDILGNSNKVAQEIFFSKPTSVDPIYDVAFNVQEMEDIEDWLVSPAPKMANVQMGLRQNSFMGSFRPTRTPEPADSDLDSSSVSSSEAEGKEEVTWPEVAWAMDNLFFILFIFINVFATVIAFTVVGTH